MTESAIPEIGPRQVDAVLRYLPLFERENFVPGEWQTPEGQFQWFLYSPEVDAFVRTLYEQAIILVFDWPSWKEEAERYESDPSSLEQADLLAVRKLLTAHVRADRFTEGHLGSVLRSGHIVGILRRLKRIRETMGRSA